MYQLSDPVLSIKGIGQNLNQALAQYQIEQLLDFLLFLPLRYEDRSLNQDIATTKEKSASGEISDKEFVTLKAKLVKWQEYRKGRLLIGRASIADQSGQINCLWFNNKFLKNQLEQGQEYFFSGKIKDGQLMQAKVEKIGGQNLHTGRLVPIYPKLGELKQGKLRRLLAETLSKLHQAGELTDVFRQLHFPEKAEQVISARERLALEEIAYLLQKSAYNKQLNQSKPAQFKLSKNEQIDQKLPFELTKAQNKAVQEILDDLKKNSPMNRLLVGDVGSGKTIVAALPASLLVAAGQNVCLLAPTKILAKQHFDKLQDLLPKINFSLIKSDEKFQLDKSAAFYIGTHNLLNQLKTIRPSLVIYDEQQRFGVKHRQLEEHLQTQDSRAHLLSMTATPIPRSLMLSIFSHLELSYLDEMPNQRQMAKTWLIPKQKEAKAVEWLVKELLNSKHQALVVCPFISPSAHQATENVAAVEETLALLQEELQKNYQRLRIPAHQQFQIAMLHSKLGKQKQQQIIEQVYNKEIQILVSTPMIEVGVDLPNADIMLIRSAERFGLSSLHQLRGRVGRRGQTSYCLLFSSADANKNPASRDRLEKFCQEKNGLKLAELDLANRGAGDLLGYQQSGLHNLRFASWTNIDIIQQAQALLQQNKDYQSLLAPHLDKLQTSKLETITN